MSVQPSQQQTIPTIVNRNQDNFLPNSRNDQGRQQKSFSPVKQNQPFINVSNQASGSQPQRGRGGGAARGRGVGPNGRGARGGLVHNRLGNATTASTKGITQPQGQGPVSRVAPMTSQALGGTVSL